VTQSDMDKVQERLYIIRWTFEGIKETEKRVETYQWEQRQEALTRYMKLKEQWYASDLKFQIAQPQDVNVDQFLNSF
jgi:beta-lactamase superfamily II metal-dependent hydrolase